MLDITLTVNDQNLCVRRALDWKVEAWAGATFSPADTDRCD